MHRALQQIFSMRLGRHLLDFTASRFSRLVICLSLAGLSSLLIWSMLSGLGKTRVAAPEDRGHYVSRPNPALVSQQVAASHIFGMDSSSPSAADTTTNHEADVEVQGILFSDDKDSAWVILEVNGKSSLFKTGDALPDGEQVIAIMERAVEIGGTSSQRTIELQQAFGNDASSILLAGETGLVSPRRPVFPGDAQPSAPYTPLLHPVALQSNIDPLSQMRALREQLIRH